MILALSFALYTLAVLLLGMLLPTLFTAAVNEITHWRIRRDVLRRIQNEQAIKDATRMARWSSGSEKTELQA